MFTLFILEQPGVLYAGTLITFFIALLFVEGMKYADRKSMKFLYGIFVTLTVLTGVVGWVGFFVTLLSYTNAGMHP